MGSFGEELRAARISKGVALEDITEITKISQRHLVALEQDKYRLLPGGILSKGIVRGYATAVGLDVSDWTARFLKASAASGESVELDKGWEEFASNVGRVRMERREAAEQRMRWAGAIVLMAAAVIAGFLTVRYFGMRAGWWSTLLPVQNVSAKTHAMILYSVPFLKR
ncbi:MAG TPA: helix-turn-helix domain-containing protein [Terracidiphilus sp.]|nr:helix-turn-helix domain-containing protein [Terracidiphilus sp.]